MDKAVALSCQSHFGGPGFVTQRFLSHITKCILTNVVKHM